MVSNWIGGAELPAADGGELVKLNPADGAELWRAARSRAADVAAAVAAAQRAQSDWAARTPVERGDLLRAAALLLRERRDEVARTVHLETGKSMADARGETLGAFEMGMFVAGEGRRFYGRTTTSAVRDKTAATVRQPIGTAGLIVPANTPIANCAWKAFPALLCGNAAVLKSAEDAPSTALLFARILHDAGLPPGVFNVIHGYGPEAGAPLAAHPAVGVVSFTGSFAAGALVAQAASARLAKVCVEAGGKNPLVVCDDADLEAAVDAAVRSAFSNAGQRCAAGSRVIVFDAVYDAFRERLLARTARLRLGTDDQDDLGPVINESHLSSMLAAIAGADVLCGGSRVARPGFYMTPTWIEDPSPALSCQELFGPIAALHRVRDFAQALALANDSPYGLVGSIHTSSLHRAMSFLAGIRTGVAVVNGPTFGSEPHLPFGGFGHSGNGTREAGTEALDVYSEWQTLYVNFRPGAA
jgi:aldehyde dehydrogenase (NAD+)